MNKGSTKYVKEEMEKLKALGYKYSVLMERIGFHCKY